MVVECRDEIIQQVTDIQCTTGLIFRQLIRYNSLLTKTGFDSQRWKICRSSPQRGPAVKPMQIPTKFELQFEVEVAYSFKIPCIIFHSTGSKYLP
jgi:hypothetical protein